MSISLERRGLLPDGNYRVRIKEAEVAQGEKGPYIKVTLEVLESNGKPTERLLWDNVSLSAKAAGLFDQFLDGFALATEGNMSYKQFCRHIQGKQGVATVGRRLFKGQYRNDVSGYVTPEAAEQMELSDAPVYQQGEYTPDEDDEDSSEPQAFKPSSPLDDEVEEDTPDPLEGVTEGTDEDIPF